jgi:uncharacterized protein (DUF1330 family)
MSSGRLNPSYGTVHHEFVDRLESIPPEDDGPVWMVNLIAHRDRAVYDGAESELSGREADDLYAPLEVLADIGAEVVFFGEVAEQFLGDDPRWDRVAVVKYPSRNAFMSMQQRPDYLERHVHKEAGVARTIIVATTPMDVRQNHAAPEDYVDWSEVPHPPTAEDGPAMVLHLIRFNPGGADLDMVDYQDHAATVAVPQGVRIAGWFGVEGTVVGDDREWDQARFNLFPSRAAFLEVVLDPGRLEAQHRHREVAIADTYTVLVRPLIDRIEQSRAGY